MIKNIYLSIKKIIITLYKIVKNSFLCVAFTIKSVFVFIKSFFIAIKSLIDLIYKTCFILFVVAVGYSAYKIYVGANTMNKKLDQVIVSLQSLSSIMDSGNKTLQKTTDATKNIIDTTTKTTQEIKQKGNSLIKKIKDKIVK